VGSRGYKTYHLALEEEEKVSYIQIDERMIEEDEEDSEERRECVLIVWLCSKMETWLWDPKEGCAHFHLQ